MNEEVVSATETSGGLQEDASPAASAVCIFCQKVGCVDLLADRTPEAEKRALLDQARMTEALASGPDGHARTVFHRARLLEENEQPSRPMHGVCLDCLALEGTMNVAHLEATRILVTTASLDPGATIATMAFLAHLICHNIENLDSLQDRLVSSKPLFHVLFPVLPPPSPLNPNRGRAGFDLGLAHIISSLLVQHSVPVACMAIMLVMHAKAYESGENMDTLQEALRCGEQDFLSVKGMLTKVQGHERSIPLPWMHGLRRPVRP